MSKLPKKLRIFKAKMGFKNSKIREATGAKTQSVVNWANDKYCPDRLRKKHAIALVELTKGYITLRDCGWK